MENIIMIKNNWQIKKLGEVCDVIAGQSPEGIFYNSNGKGLPFYQGKKEFGEKYIEEPRIWTTKITKKAQKNDILMSVRAPVGPINFSTQEICIGRGLAAIRPNEKVNYNFLFYFLLSKQDGIIGNAGAVFASINKYDIENLNIYISSLPEQHRIVKILDDVFEKIAKAKENVEKNLQNSKELFESYLQNIFSNPGKDWDEKNLGEFIKLEYGKPLDKKDRNSNGKYPVYGANGEKDRSDKFYYNHSTIIIGRKGSAGEMNLTEDKFWPLDVTYFVTFNDKKFDLKFIYFLLLTLKLTKLAKGVKPGINRNEVYSINVFVPGLLEQKQIVAKLDALSAETKKLEEIYKKKLADLEELKKSVLKKAFSGGVIGCLKIKHKIA